MNCYLCVPLSVLHGKLQYHCRCFLFAGQGQIYHTMPWLISIALFHGRKDVNQPFSLSGFLDDFLNPVILAESPQLMEGAKAKQQQASSAMQMLPLLSDNEMITMSIVTINKRAVIIPGE